MILIDTSALIDSLTGPKRSSPYLRAFIADGNRIGIPTLVLYEWLRGPRLPEELGAQEAVMPSHEAIAFGPEAAARAAQLHQEVARSRGREVDLAIAAVALVQRAALWTLNEEDFTDIPGLQLA